LFIISHVLQHRYDDNDGGANGDNDGDANGGMVAQMQMIR
jgi:hypothetical protein